MVYRFGNFTFDVAGYYLLVFLGLALLVFFVWSFIHWYVTRVHKKFDELDDEIAQLREEQQLDPPKKNLAEEVPAEDAIAEKPANRKASKKKVVKKKVKKSKKKIELETY